MTLTTSLRQQVTGPVVVPGDPDYEDARHVYNFMIDKHPAVVVRCANTHDVQVVIREAHATGSDLAVRGGGHSVPGYGTWDGAIVADLSAMNQILVDPERRIARVGGGATWAMLNEAAAAHGLATTGGIVSTTGVAWPHPRRGDRLPGAEVRPVLRQPALCRGGSRQRPDRDRQRGRARRPVLGAARRRRQLRGGHAVRVPSSPGK